MRGSWGMPAAVTVVAAGAIAFGACKTNNITSNNSTNNYITQTVDKTGGTLRHSSGLALVVPVNALAQATTLTIGTQSDGAYPQLPAGMTAQGPVFTVMPHGQTFDQKITIYMPIPSAGASNVEVYEAGGDNGTWAPVTYPDAVANMSDSFDSAAKISVTTQHFSYYALLSSSSPPVALTGTWSGNVTIVSDNQCVPTNSFPATLSIMQSGSSFTGTVSNPTDGGMNTSNIDGTISGNTVTINVNVQKCDSPSGMGTFVLGPCNVSGKTITCSSFGGHTCIPCNGQHPLDNVKSANATFTMQ